MRTFWGHKDSQRGILGFRASQELWDRILYFINAFGAGPSKHLIFLCPTNKSLAHIKSYLGIAWGRRMIFFFYFYFLCYHHFWKAQPGTRNDLATWVPFGYIILTQSPVPQQQMCFPQVVWVFAPAPLHGSRHEWWKKAVGQIGPVDRDSISHPSPPWQASAHRCVPMHICVRHSAHCPFVGSIISYKEKQEAEINQQEIELKHRII